MTEIGTLVIVVLKAKDLPDKHFYKQDVFAQVTLNGTSKRTKLDVKGGQHPLWDEEIRFPVYKDTTAKHRTLEVECFSKETRSDESVGKGSVDISDTLKTGEFDDWVPLSLNNVQRGEIFLEMTYFASGPAPIQRRPSKMNPSERMWRPPQTSPAKTPPKGTSPQRPEQAGHSPRYGDSHLVPPGRTSVDAPLPPTPENGHAHKSGGSASPPASKPAAIPPLLRPGNLASPPQPLHASKPLPPEHPVHAAQLQSSPPFATGSLPLPGTASPPITASAYPPASTASIYPAPPPASLLPAGGAPPAHRSPSPGYFPASGLAEQYRGSSPYPQQQHQGPGLGLSGPDVPALSFPVPMPAPTAAPAADPIYDSNYNYVGSPPPVQGATGAYGSGYHHSTPSPAPPNRYNYASPPPAASNGYHPPAPSPAGYHHTSPAPAPTNAYPARSRPPLREDDYGSAVATPRAEVQPQHQPLFPQHLRQEQHPPPPAHPTTQPLQPRRQQQQQQQQPAASSSSTFRQQPPVVDRDAQAAAEIQRMEEEQERARREQEERDMKLALELDREFNAPPEGQGNASGLDGKAHMPGQW